MAYHLSFINVSANLEEVMPDPIVTSAFNPSESCNLESQLKGKLKVWWPIMYWAGVQSVLLNMCAPLELT